jgi:hypothetical protein
MLFEQIVIGGDGISLVERVSSGGNTDTAVAGLLRRSEYVSKVVSAEQISVRSVLVVEGLDHPKVAFGIELVPACPGWLLGRRGGLQPEVVQRVTSSIAEAFPAGS